MRTSILPTAIVLLLISGHVGAVTRTVDTLSDVTNSLDGLTTLREAVTASAAGDEINFTPALNGKTIFLEQGEIELAKSIEIRASALGRPVISSPKIDPHRLFVVPDGVAPILAYLTLRGGRAENGGAILSEGNLSLEGCRFEDNVATDTGGAVHHSRLILTMRNCVFVGNSAVVGGAVSSGINSFMSAEDCEFEGNISTGEAGLIAAGGAVYSRASDASLNRCRFVGNVADGDGSAVAATDGGLLSAQNCVFVGNTTRTLPDPTGAVVSVFRVRASFGNCAFAGNFSGGVKLQSEDLGGSLKNCTFSGHAQRSILAFDYDLELRNCVIWNNRSFGGMEDPEASLQLSGDSALSATYSLLQNWDLTGDGVGNFDGTDAANDPGFASPFDPLLAPQESGDLTPDLFSAVVNAGDSTIAVGNTDAAGNPRLVSAEVDLGAYEVQQQVLYVDASSVADPPDGATWVTAYPTLGDALDTVGPGDVLALAAGVYRPDQGEGRVAGNVAEQFIINHPIVLRGGYPAGGGVRDVEANKTIISGDLGDDDLSVGGITRRWGEILGDNSANLFSLSQGVDEEVLLDGLVLTGADGTVEAGLEIGAIVLDMGPVRLLDCQLRGNRRVATGRDAEIEFRRCKIAGNSGVPGATVAFFRSDVSYINTLITGNGEHFDHEAGTVTVVNVELSGNGIGIRLSGAATGEFTNVTAAGNGRVPFLLYGTSHANFTNTIIWNNAEDEVPEASVWMVPEATASFSHCIVQHRDLRNEGAGNFDGTDLITNPAFLQPAQRTWAPLEGGIYSLASGSPAKDAGDSAANPEPFDLAGGPRVRGAAITLGATEEIFAPFDEDVDQLPDWWEFEHSDPQGIESFDPQGDDDGDGIVNVAEFVHGLDPLSSNGTADYLEQRWVEVDGEQYFALAYRHAPASSYGFSPSVQHSVDLGIDDAWSNFPIERVPDAEGAFERVYRSIEPYGSLPAEFLRVKISTINLIAK